MNYKRIPKKMTRTFLSVVVFVTLTGFAADSVPKGWLKAGSPPPPGACDASQVAAISLRDVEVRAAEPRVRQRTAFNDCCLLCDHQILEALVPTPQGPKQFEVDRRLPLRRKFCGTITKYGVNDEVEDPRDFNINIRPAPVSPYPDFVVGFLHTDETPLSAEDSLNFGPLGRLAGVPFNLQACLQKAADEKIRVRKVIHAEVTPDEHFYGADGRFLPIEGTAQRCGASGLSLGNIKCLKCISGEDCQSELEPSGALPGEEACVYGVYAYDHGGHSASSHTQLCRMIDNSHDLPEIHPFDAIWWRHPERKGWMFGVFQDDSNRYSFPHCGSQNNGNEWSQPPRDLTFRFPFRFPRRSAPQKACLRHVRTRNLKDNMPNTVRPLNVTTGKFVNPGTEVIALTVGGQRLLEVVKESGTERETHVRVEGRIVGDDVVGQIILRVVVGCDDRTGTGCIRPDGPRDHRPPLFDRLRQTNGLVNYDKSDPGAGYYYAELTFECACSR